VQVHDSVRTAFQLMKERDLSQLPVMDGLEIAGSITETQVLRILLENPLTNSERPVREIMDSPFATVQEDLPISQLNRYMTKEMPAVIVRDRSGGAHIVSQYDLIQAI